MDRSSVALPVPGGPSSTTCRRVASATVRTSRSRRRPTTAVDKCGSAVELDDAADVLAVVHVLVALLDLVERVGLGDQLVELQEPVLVELQLPEDVPVRVGHAEHRALDA